ncbi:glutathione peroxidase [Carboxylicivirga sediminis]|uniref:Glutathione peroxidase n=1 Tax=Carboxylicivirga sediminis TaxID=2006564 RepID=A0A941F2G5_9BACT|nr:glutathione peroxidase [Carboxylicivirga sediminis]MBR8534908.1 glutathione peroxidase [Carboxylicivirga sediminis]
MKQTFAILTLILLSCAITYSQQSFYDFKVNTIDGQTYDLSALKGKKVMVVNVASKCGLTPQYEQLQKVHELYGGDDFMIIGFPANNFLSQEPGSDDEIKTFCTDNYGVTFLMMSKISVKGDDIHPLYRWLTTGELNNFGDSKVKWNFQKYLINKQGEIEKVIDPKTKPDDQEIIEWIMN